MQIPMPSAIMSVKERAVSRMYRVAVCEDEKNLREDLCAQCAAILSELQIEHTVTPYSSAEELEASFSAGAEFSLLCLDILMDGKTGMKLAQELRERDDRTSILFITGSTEFLKDGYSVRPIQYLLKPVSREDLEQAIKTDLRLYHQPRTVPSGWPAGPLSCRQRISSALKAGITAAYSTQHMANNSFSAR